MITAIAAAIAFSVCAPTADTLTVVEADDARGAVVFLHGWSQGMLADQILPFVDDTAMVRDMVADGWSVYAPFLDSDWGSGLGAVEVAVEAARADGFDAVRLVGVSAGAATAANWAWRNPEDVDGLYLITPVFDLAAVHAADTPEAWTNAQSITASIDATYPEGFAEFDPAEHVAELSAVADRTWVFAAHNDEIIDYTSLLAWAGELGVSVSTSGGGHIYATTTMEWAVTLQGWFG